MTRDKNIMSLLLYSNKSLFSITICQLCPIKSILIDSKLSFNDVCGQLRKYLPDDKSNFEKTSSFEKTGTDELIISGIHFTCQQISYMLELGFKKINIFLDKLSDNKLYTITQSEETAAIDSTFDPRVFTFSHESFYACFPVTKSIWQLYVMDCVLCLTFVDYNIKIKHSKEVNVKNSNALIISLANIHGSFEAGLEHLFKLETGPCADYITSMIFLGISNMTIVQKQNEHMAIERINTQSREFIWKGVKGVSIPIPDLEMEIYTIIKKFITDKSPEAEFFLLYRRSFLKRPTDKNELKSSESKTAESKTAESKTAESKTAESKTAESKQDDGYYVRCIGKFDESDTCIELLTKSEDGLEKVLWIPKGKFSKWIDK